MTKLLRTCYVKRKKVNATRERRDSALMLAVSEGRESEKSGR